MKKFIFSLFLILLVSECAGMPDIFNGIFPGGNNVNKTELSPDLIIIKNINVIPNPPINTLDQFSVSFEIINQDELKEASNVKYELYDWGLCDPLTTEGDPIVGTFDSLAPLQTEFKQWRFQAPDNNEIGYLSTRCPIRFKINYTYTSTSQIDLDVISKDRLEQLQKAGTPPSFTPSLSVGRGPVKIYFSFGNELPIKSENTISLFVKVEDKGTGMFGEIKNKTLIINFPDGFKTADVDCGSKFNCTDNYLTVFCFPFFGQKPTTENNVCDTNNDGIINMRDIQQTTNIITEPTCYNNQEIPLIKKTSPQIRCSIKAPIVNVEKTFFIKGYLGYSYDVDGETSVGVKPTSS